MNTQRLIEVGSIIKTLDFNKDEDNMQLDKLLINLWTEIDSDYRVSMKEMENKVKMIQESALEAQKTFNKATTITEEQVWLTCFTALIINNKTSSIVGVTMSTDAAVAEFNQRFR